jgi:hypothetical protein
MQQMQASAPDAWPPAATGRVRTLAQRQRRSEAAGRKLAELGA